jgi:hypothetical protein
MTTFSGHEEEEDCLPISIHTKTETSILKISSKIFPEKSEIRVLTDKIQMLEIQHQKTNDSSRTREIEI